MTGDSAVLSLLAMIFFGGLVLYGIVSFFMSRKLNPDERVNWNVAQSICVVLAAYAFSQVIVSGVLWWLEEFDIDGFAPLEWLNGTTGQFVFALVIQAIIVGLLVLFMRRRKTRLSAIGVVRPRIRDAGMAIIGFLVYFVSYLLLIYVVSAFVPGLDLEQEQEIGFDKSTVGLALIPIFVSLVILPPLVEEFIFRGFVYTGLRNKLKVWSAGLVTSALFAAAHLQFGSGNTLLYVAAIDTFILSMVMVNLRERSGSLWPSIGLHAIKNGIAFTVLFIYKV